MRAVIPAILAVLAAPIWPTLALADRIEARGPVTAVTLYPHGATVTRTVRAEAPAGRHEIVVPGLPAGIDPAYLRVAVPEGVRLGAVRLSNARQPDTEPALRPEVEAAEAEVRALRDEIAEARRGIALISARSQAAKARVEVVQGQAARAGEGTPDAATLAALAALVADEVLAARAIALEVEADVIAAERALDPQVEALGRAEARLAALVAWPEVPGAVLEIAVEVATAATLDISLFSLTESAGWSPVHDLRLDRDAGTLTLSRGAMAWQRTEEDWSGVALTLSTARPSDRSAPADLRTDLRRIVPKADLLTRAPLPDMRMALDVSEAPAFPGMATVAPEVAIDAVVAQMQGLTFAYRFATAVTLRSGADDLRLEMSPLTFDAEVRAEAVPLVDPTAFLVADWVNTGTEPVLPGPAILFADGALAGGADLPLVPPGGRATTGFGAIDGLTVSRRVPDRSAGATGFLTTANRQVETAVLTMENLTGAPWPVRVLDRVPVSEQDALRVTWSATPMPGETDVDGRRGVLAWIFDLAPGATREITLEHRLDWPEDQVLR